MKTPIFSTVVISLCALGLSWCPTTGAEDAMFDNALFDDFKGDHLDTTTRWKYSNNGPPKFTVKVANGCAAGDGAGGEWEALPAFDQEPPTEGHMVVFKVKKFTLPSNNGKDGPSYGNFLGLHKRGIHASSPNAIYMEIMWETDSKANIFASVKKDGTEDPKNRKLLISVNQGGAYDLKIEWGPGRANFYVDDVLKATLTDAIPDVPLNVYFRDELPAFSFDSVSVATISKP